MFSHKERMIKIEVTDCERRIILNALTQLRDQQIRENKNYDFIETIIAKSARADTLKGTRKIYEER